MTKKRSARPLVLIPVLLLAVAAGATYLDIQATKGAAYLGLPTVPCLDFGKAIVQDYQLTIKVSENGQDVPLPATLGHDYGNCLHDIHADDTGGQVHIESNYKDQLTLGQFFDVWRTTFNDHQIGEKVTGGGHSLTVIADDKTFSSNLRDVPLLAGETIDVIYQ